MTPHDLLAAFDVLAEAPGGIQRLRALVLELAVRGELVPQDPNDEPASALMERIAAEKARLVKEKKIRGSRPLPPPSADEVPFEVPDGWGWCRLNDVGDWGAGATPRRGNARYYGGPHLWFKSGELNDGDLFGPSEEGITDVALLECSLRENQPGDVLIAMYGATIGKLAILQVCATTNQAVCACTCHSGVSNQFLFLFLWAWRERFISHGAGAAQPNISKEKITATPFPLPPFAEQQRIVARVDELMALLDRLEAARDAREGARLAMRDAALAALRDAPDAAAVEVAWARVAEHLDDLFTAPADVAPLRQTILQLAVRGKLVHQDPRDEPASVLLERIAAEKSNLVMQGKLKKAEPQPTTGEDKVPYEVSERWRYCRLAEVCDIVGGVTKGRRLEGRKAGTFPYLRVANVQAGFLDLSVIKTIELPLDELDRYKLAPGDVLLTEGGDWDKLGRSAIWAGEIADCIHQNHVFRARCLHDGLMPRWVSMFTNSPDGRTYFQSCSKQTTNLASINMTQLRNCPLPVPPAAEQRRIVAKVDELMALCDALEARLRAVQDAQAAFAAAAVHHLDT